MQVAHASPLTYSGTFSRDDEHFALTFELKTATNLVAYTTSWASGGFAPVLTLFGDPGGVQQASGSSNLCGAGSGAPDQALGYCWDAKLSAYLEAGTYTLALTQDQNLAAGFTLGEGFTLDGNPNYTAEFYGSQNGLPMCVNVDASARSCAFSLTVDGVATPVGEAPEPAVYLLLAAGLFGLHTNLRRNRRN